MTKAFQLPLTTLKDLYRQIRYLYWSAKAKKWDPLPVTPRNEGARVLILLPESGIHSYIKSMVAVAQQIKLKGYQVYFARCYNLFERCMFMDSETLSIEATAKQKALLCTYCYRSFQRQVIDNGFESIDLRHFSDEADRQAIHDKINQHSTPFDFTYDGINFSGLLEYNFYLYLKKTGLTDLSPSEIKLWQHYLSGLYVGYHAVKRLIPKLNISHILMFDGYSLNSIIKCLADQQGVSIINLAYPFHKDIDVTKLRVLHQDVLTSNYEAVDRWHEFKHLSLSASQIKDAVDDLIIRMSKRGIYTYSQSKSKHSNFFEKFNLDQNRKIIVAYPSSPDEVDAIINARQKKGLPLVKPDDAFSDQFHWLDELIEFTEKSNQFQLIIRLHPRLAPNHREKWGCAAKEEFLKRYAKDYQHVRIIWPEDKTSSFDLADIADVVTVAWSSLGLFMARLGIPVVSGLKVSLPVPNDEFCLFCKTKESYFATIERLCHTALSLEHLKEAYRCYQLLYLGYTVDLSDVVQHDGQSSAMLSKNSESLEQTIIHQKNVLDINLQNLHRNSEQNKIAEEKALTQQLYRLIHFLMTNNDHEQISIFPIKNEERVHLEGDGLMINYPLVSYCHQGKITTKYSPLVARLALLLLGRSMCH
ncbi:MAG: hypothetical protein ACHQJ6_01325 [Candidatus Berkiellales bacterium]